MAPTKRLVFFPHGRVKDPEAQQACEALLMHCDADVSRFVDTSAESIEANFKVVKRLENIVNGRAPVIVALTRTSPLALQVIHRRRRLSGEFPSLTQALWVIFMDEKQDPFFESEAEKLGSFDSPLASSPIWRENTTDERYLVLTPSTKDIGLLRSQLFKIRMASAPLSRHESSTSLEAVLDPSTRKP